MHFKVATKSLSGSKKFPHLSCSWPLVCWPAREGSPGSKQHKECSSNTVSPGQGCSNTSVHLNHQEALSEADGSVGHWIVQSSRHLWISGRIKSFGLWTHTALGKLVNYTINGLHLASSQKSVFTSQPLELIKVLVASNEVIKLPLSFSCWFMSQPDRQINTLDYSQIFCVDLLSQRSWALYSYSPLLTLNSRVSGGIHTQNFGFR